MKKIVLFSVLSLAVGFLAVGDLWANNVRITSQPKLVSRDEPAEGYVTIQFGLSWENSWKANRPKNYDAVWIYVKCWNGNEWRHAYLDNDSTKHHFGTPGSPQKVLGEDNMGTETQDEFARMMVIECGKSQVQMIGEDVAEPRVTGTTGVFIYRRGNGRGTINLTSVNLLWNYMEQGFFPDDELAVKVFAVEMVYVPQGDYYLGGVGSEEAGFTTNSSTANRPMRITSENAIQCASSAAETTLYATAGMVSGNIPAAYPKGWKAFYIMKYELTHEGWADVLNTWDFARQNAHTQGNLNTIAVGQQPWGNVVDQLLMFRYGLVCTKIGDVYEFGCDLDGDGTFNETTGTGDAEIKLDGQDVAISFISWYDLLAYADFAGLRPMTELEYEKACRGVLYPVANEYAWGNVFLKLVNERWNNTHSDFNHGNTLSLPGGATYNTYRVITNPNRGDERFAAIYNATGIYSISGWVWNNGSWWWNNSSRHSSYPGPVRVGAFADATTNRQAAGASYWGIMNLSDNVSELCVHAGTANGRLFDGQHGDGILQPNGDPSPVHFNGGYTSTDFWIARGMNQYMRFEQASTGGNSGWYPSPGSWYYSNYATGYSPIQIHRGQVSNRGLHNHDQLWTTRNTQYINESYQNVGSGTGGIGGVRQNFNYMGGIRCVRTQGVTK